MRIETLNDTNSGTTQRLNPLSANPTKWSNRLKQFDDSRQAV